ncbi:uncharacterized protein VP01_7961g2 [Puccinia sorghi]|uniref:Uncharacterized protein n=1 Tax=Puccinia sorghi TaxID=27349 RepID=A0A0L6UAN7_9BASI|nr:uncharacterized protein VP01_7961g2 [Puccinia sorghi]
MAHLYFNTLHVFPPCYQGFDGSKQTATYIINLKLEHNLTPDNMIITTLKDSYDSILGMPWIRKYGQLINWSNGCFVNSSPSIAATALALSHTAKPLKVTCHCKRKK